MLNGPQGTLFGRSSAAGAVLIYPNRPNLSEWGGWVNATIGSYDREQFTGIVNVPIVTDHLALRVAVNANHVDGYTSEFGFSQKLDGIAINNSGWDLSSSRAASTTIWSPTT